LFEVTYISIASVVFKLKELLNKFSLTKKIVAYVKNVWSNLQTCANALTSIVSCNTSALLEPLDVSFFWHALSKVCQYVIANEKMSIDLPCAPIKATQFAIYVVLHGPKSVQTHPWVVLVGTPHLDFFRPIKI